MGELSEIPPEREEREREADLIFEFKRKNIFWRNIRRITEKRRDYREFLIPQCIFDAETSIQKEFVRGFADVAGKVRRSNVYHGGIHRIYLDVLNDNWQLPIELCHLLQDHLRIPIQTITWGHPNLRNKPNEPWTKREHQIKIFCEDFLPIGFYIEHKQCAFRILAQENIDREHVSKFCSPPGKRFKPNPPHPDENHPDLPSQIRGHHYDTFRMICRDMGCHRWRAQTQLIREE